MKPDLVRFHRCRAFIEHVDQLVRPGLNVTIVFHNDDKPNDSIPIRCSVDADAVFAPQIAMLVDSAPSGFVPVGGVTYESPTRIFSWTLPGVSDAARKAVADVKDNAALNELSDDDTQN